MTIFILKKNVSAKDYLMQALLEILATEELDMITVKQLVNKAGVNRSTFYTHFQDKYDLMDSLREEITSELLRFYDHKEEKPLTIYQSTLQICQHIFRYQYFYKCEFNQPVQTQKLSELLAGQLGQVYDDESYAIFAGYGTVGFLTYWVKGDFEMSPREAAEQLMKIGVTDWSV